MELIELMELAVNTKYQRQCSGYQYFGSARYIMVKAFTCCRVQVL
jgi:hypothetical protein